MRTPAVRLVPAPPLEPPFDDQRPPEAYPLRPGAGAQLTLQWRSPDPPRAETPRAETPHAETPHAESPHGESPQEVPHGESPHSATTGASQPAWHAALRFLDRCQEILNGYRPASHLRPMSDPLAAQAVIEHVAAVARRTTRLPRTPQPGVRPGAQPNSVARRRMRVCEPRPGAAEAMAVLSQAGRSWAVAFRLERRGTAWLCTAFTDVIGQP
jgi:hypothetical protein